MSCPPANPGPSFTWAECSPYHPTQIGTDLRFAIALREVVHGAQRSIPWVRERLVRLSQTQYDSMLLGVYQLLLARQLEITAYKEYIEGVRDYWVARSDLERVVGGRLPAP